MGLEFPEFVVVYCACSDRVMGYMKIHKTSSRSRMFEYTVMSECTALLGQRSGFGGFWTVASARALCQPTIVVQVFLESLSTSLELNWN